jgi:hypothetical protein
VETSGDDGWHLRRHECDEATVPLFINFKSFALNAGYALTPILNGQSRQSPYALTLFSLE